MPHFQMVVRRGWWITMAGIFEYLFQHGDDIIVGKLLGSSALGLYQVGYKISTMPISEVADIVSQVVFPVYAKFSSDLPRLKRAFIQTVLAVFLITLPISLAIFLIPEFLVSIILGKRWLDAVPVIQVLALFGLVRGISNSSSPLFLALKRQNLVAFLSFLSFLLLVLFIVPFIKLFGLIGAGLAASASAFVVFALVLLFIFAIFRTSST
jgi:PST family polysaccharide transporter/lipopolysaccharide exporter